MNKLVKILTKVLSVTLMSFIIANILSNTALAAGAFLNASSFDSVTGKAPEVSNLVGTAAGTISGVLRIIGVTIALVMLLAIAMKYMISSAGDRADIKKHAVAYVVGAVVLFGATNIIAALIDFTDKTLNSTT